MTDWEEIEQHRLDVQAALDIEKSSANRNKMGQFATPTELARDVLRHGVSLMPKDELISFFDPAFGTGSFYSALRFVVPDKRIKKAVGIEIDPHYGQPASEIWAGTALDIRLADFTKAKPKKDERASLLICNPPYVRHHHIDKETKSNIQNDAEAACGVRINGLSGLYCYFMGLAHSWMCEGGIAGWLIPSEFMDVNYGRQVKEYLLNKVTLLHIHRFDPADVQFTDALVSSAVVWFKNSPPPEAHEVKITFGGTLANPAIEKMVSVSILQEERKWTRYPLADAPLRKASLTIGDLFEVKRGLATGDNSFFIMTRDRIDELGLPFELFRPVLPGSKHISGNLIYADEVGVPLLDKQLFLLDTVLSEQEISHRFPILKAYLETGRKGETPVSNRYLCRTRRPWYAQEKRPAAPIICTYMGRISKANANPFRFIVNHSNATACNTYLMLYPKPIIAKILEDDFSSIEIIGDFLNNISPEELVGNGRVYGGGLHKMEPKELRGVSADDLLNLIPQLALSEKHGNHSEKQVA